jgi:thiamine-phosphate diphosphorylase
VASIVRRYPVRFFLHAGNRGNEHDRISLAIELGCDGIQLPDNSITVDEIGEMGLRGSIGRSVHQGTALAALAERTQPHFFLLAPIWPVTDKRDSPAVGLSVLRDFCSRSSVPVFALGGMTPERTAEALESGAYGMAIRSSLWNSLDPAATLKAYREVLKW